MCLLEIYLMQRILRTSFCLYIDYRAVIDREESRLWSRASNAGTLRKMLFTPSFPGHRSICLSSSYRRIVCSRASMCFVNEQTVHSTIDLMERSSPRIVSLSRVILLRAMLNQIITINWMVSSRIFGGTFGYLCILLLDNLFVPLFLPFQFSYICCHSYKYILDIFGHIVYYVATERLKSLKKNKIK